MNPKLPKAELHCHLEGTVSPALALKLAARHGQDISRIMDEQGRYKWRDFGEFLTAYDTMSDTIQTPEDQHDVVYEYYRAAAAEGLIYGEMFFSPAHAARNGIGYRDYVECLAGAIGAVERDFGVVVRLILTCVRHWGADQALETAGLAARWPHPVVTGFGLAGDENFGAPRDFAKAFAAAGDAGLRLTAHAGELAGPESVAATLEALKVERIGHGVRAVENPGLVAEIAARGVTLELCPSSNLALGLYADYAAHPIGALSRAGVKTTISTDDPPFFFTTIGREYAQTASAHALDDEAMLGFTARAIESAFCTESTKAGLRQRLAQWRNGATGA